MIIDFYIVEANTQQTEMYACRLLNKIYQQQRTALVVTADHSQSMRFDQLLWTFDDSSFIPHALAHEADAPIIIHHEDTFKKHILVNLSGNMLQDLAGFERIIELIPQEATLRDRARERYRKYREIGCELSTHKIKV